MNSPTHRATDYLARYEEIAAVSRRMLLAARQACWDDVVALQEEFLALVDGLDPIGKVALDARARVHRMELLNRILDDDAAIRDLADPQAARLSIWLNLHRPRRYEEAAQGAHR